MKQVEDKKAHKFGTLQTIEVVGDIDAIKDEWRQFQAAAAGGPHDSWEWNEAWLKSAGAACDPLIVTGRDASGGLLFLLPLTICLRSGVRVLEWLSSEQGNYASGLFHPTAWQEFDLPRGEELMSRVTAALPPIDVIHLSDQPDTLGEQLNPLGGIPGVPCASPGHILPLSAGWEAHYEAQFSSKQRSRLRNLERQLKAHDPVVIEDVTDATRRLVFLDGMIAEKQEWFAEKGIPDFFAKPGMREFFRGLACTHDIGSEPRLRIFILRAGDDVVATNIGMQFQNRFYGLIASTTSGPLRRYGPGRLLFLKMVECLSAEGLQLIDCGAGEDPDKLKWCTAKRERFHAIAPLTAKGSIYAAALKVAINSKRQIKQTPAAWKLAQRARQLKSAVLRPEVAVGAGAIASLFLIDT